MAAGIAWVLNLDADLELAAPRYTAKESVRQAMRPFASRLAATLLAPGDLLVDANAKPGLARGMRGRAFCPTPSAIATLTRAGAELEAHPSVDVLRRVNSRAFAASLGATLPGGAFVTRAAEAEAILATDPPVGDGWRIKRAFGMAGRGQRVVTPRAPAQADLALIRASVAEGGVQIEPNVAIEREYAVHGLLDRDGAMRIGELVVQRCDEYGAWVSSEAASVGHDEAIRDVRRRLLEEARRVGDALHAACYFGPFNIDAFTYRDRAGELTLQPRSEINARYTMAFAASGLALR